MTIPVESPEARRAAFEREALVHLKVVYSMARRIEVDPAAVEDLVQETYLRAYRTFDNFERGTNAVAWLLTILRSIQSNRRRRMVREPETRDDQQLETIGQRSARGVDWEQEAIQNRETGVLGAGEKVEHAIRELPDDFRQVVLMVDYAEMTYEEAAQALDCPVGTVRSRLARARRKLAVRLSGHARELGILSEASR